MRGISNFHHCYNFFLLFFVLVLFPAFSVSTNTLSATESLTISSNKTIVSPSHIFELGFFKTGSNPRWYLGIWYKVISKRTYVWVANRDNPLFSSIGTLKISHNNLVIYDISETTPVWSTNLTGRDVRSPVIAELLDNEMKLGWDLETGYNRILRSWRSQDDPSSGDFSFKFETRGYPQIFLWNGESPVYRSRPWNGIRFSDVPEMQPFIDLVLNFSVSNEEVTYSFKATKNNVYSRLTLNSTGFLERSTWNETAQYWNRFWHAPKDQCDQYNVCGTYSYCDTNTSPVCLCIKGFEPEPEPMYPVAWGLGNSSGGCARKTKLRCDGRDGFLELKNIKLPDSTEASVDRSIGVDECEDKCLKDCTCTAYAYKNINAGGWGCMIWTGELLDTRSYANANGSQALYVRVRPAAADLEDKRKTSTKLIGSSIGVSVLLFLSFIIYGFWKRKQKRSPIVGAQDLLVSEVVLSTAGHISTEYKREDLELPLMEFDAVAIATDNFSEVNKLGQGGFGVVYKGRLLDGKQIAVKRLSKMSVQGNDEFMNEVRLIARLQHINLVRLLGCCVDKGEKMLIYEYLANLSFDSHIFDKTRRSNLNWEMRFDITNGIARGLLYLHQDSRFRIIHRDLKASNVLLDKDMTPKISDFGMARIFGRDETEANTRKVVGTYGYMSPEYAMYGKFSMKSDVFSFGVLLLEIISGKRNNGFYSSNRDLNLLSCVWRYWKDGKGLEIVDPVILDSSTIRPQEILRCIQIGLLCVQEHAEDRPMMSSVVLMLGSETTAVPQPKTPGFCVGRSPLDSKQCEDRSCTANQITLSVLEAR